MIDKITVICECCAKEIQENKANSFYKNNNYLIVCNECYEKLLQVQVMANKCEEFNKWLPIVTRLEEQFKSHEKAKSIDYKTYAEQVFTELDQLKEENEELKGLNTRLNNQRETYWKEYQKLQQALTEIKQLLEDSLDTDKTDTEQSFDCLYKAIEKCEVLDEN